MTDALKKLRAMNVESRVALANAIVEGGFGLALPFLLDLGWTPEETEQLRHAARAAIAERLTI